eukprot:1352781-Amorphochlora_amoeboformis.AAC.1
MEEKTTRAHNIIREKCDHGTKPYINDDIYPRGCFRTTLGLGLVAFMHETVVRVRIRSMVSAKVSVQFKSRLE